MGAWQDKNGSLAGQKWEAWQKIISNTPHFESFSVIFVCLLPLLVGFCHTFLYFSHFCLFFSHLSSNLSISRTVWQDSLAEKLGTAAWQNKWPPLAGRNFGRKGLNFGRMKLLAPPKKWPRYAYGLQCSPPPPFLLTWCVQSAAAELWARVLDYISFQTKTQWVAVLNLWAWSNRLQSWYFGPHLAC